MTLSASAKRRLGLLIPMLGSDKDGEVIASVRKIVSILATEGKDLHDLTRLLSGEPTIVYKHVFRDPPRPEPKQPPRWQTHGAETDDGDWLAKAEFCVMFAGSLSEREAEFVRDMVEKIKRWGKPTEKQAGWLDSIHRKLRARHGASA